MIKKIFNATAPNNILTQKSFDTANTIYVFETEYTLNNNIFVIPANCILEFQGGRIINGGLTGNNTKIIAGTTSVFSNVTCSGTWLNSYADIRWFGVKSQNSGVDNTAAFKYGLNSGWKSIYIPEGVFKIATEIQINKSGVSIWGAGKEKTKIESPKGKSIFILKANQTNISAIYFKSEAFGYPNEGEDRKDPAKDLSNTGISGDVAIEDITIRSCIFDGFTMGIIFQQKNRNVIISECTFRNMNYLPDDWTQPAVGGAGGYGILFKHIIDRNLPGTDNYLIEKCIFENTVYRHAIYSQSSNGIITNNVFYGKSGEPKDYVTKFECRIQVAGTNDLIISDNIFNGGVYAIDLFYGVSGMTLNENVLICNNTFRNFRLVRYSNSIIKLSNVGSATIVNNSMYKNESTAIAIGEKVTNLNIANNMIKTITNPDPDPELYSHGIVAYYGTGMCDNISIHDNMIDVAPGGECCPIFFNLYENLGNIYIKNNILKNGKIGICIKPMSEKSVLLYYSNIDDNIGRLLKTLISISVPQNKVSNHNNTMY